MTAETMSPDREDVTVRGVGPGHLLRSAREKAGMTRRDVSAQLHLDERTLTSLEDDDFAVLPAPAFVRGYLRGYARLLGVPVGPVLEAYDREGFTPPDLVADIAEKPEANTTDFPVRLTTWGVVLVLGGLVIVWWNNQSVDDVPNPPAAEAPRDLADAPAADAGPAPAQASAGEPPAPRAEPPAQSMTSTTPAREPADGTAPSPATEAQATARPAPADTPSASPGSGAASADREDVTATVDRLVGQAEEVLERARAEGQTRSPAVDTADAVAPAGESAPAQTAQAPAAESAPEQPEPAAAPDDATPTAPGGAPGQGRLYVVFTAESWVEIYDADDRRLFFNLVQPGQEIDVSGKLPMRVLLGNTDGVSTIEFQGDPVDLAPHSRRGVARLTLGQ